MSSASEVHALDASMSDIGRQWEREMAVHVMTAYVAHELNHPLGTIVNLANMLLRRLARPGIGLKDLGEPIKYIKDEAVRAASIIKNMRMLSEYKPIVRESLSLLEVCYDTIARIRPLARSKQVNIRLEVRTALNRVQGVKGLLETALYNLVANSIAALDDASFIHRSVIVRIVAREPSQTAIQVLDNGVGVPDSIRDKMFEPFVTARADGSGLGLAIARDIVRWHRGRVCYRPRKSGTCMEIILPQE